MDIVVKYDLFNVGDNAATNVQVADLDKRKKWFSKICFRLQTVDSVRRTLTW